MNEVVPVYSVAKSYTAIAAIKSFNLDDPVGDHLAGLRADLGSLTFRSLLGHRSGLNDYAAWPDYRAAVEARLAPWPQEQILRRAEMGPSGRFRYSNIGFLLIRRALEQAHRGTFFDVLADLVFEPLGIEARPFAAMEDWRHCHHPAINDWLRAYDPGWVYSGTFAANPQQAARGLALALRGDSGAEVASALRTSFHVDVPPQHPLAPTAGYGLGVMTGGDGEARVVGHGGQGPGITLFAATNIWGTRWHAEVGSETDGDEPIRRCLTALR